MKLPLLLAPALLVLVLAAAAGAAEVNPEFEGGHALARAWCTSCHAVEPGQMAGPYADVPSFAAVARLPSTTSPALHAFLSSPHTDMPDIKFTDAQLNDIVAYILSLGGK